MKPYSLGSFFDKELGGLLSVVFILFICKMTNTKTHFLQAIIYVKDCMYRVKPVIALGRFCIVTNNHAASFSILESPYIALQ